MLKLNISMTVLILSLSAQAETFQEKLKACTVDKVNQFVSANSIELSDPRARYPQGTGDVGVECPNPTPDPIFCHVNNSNTFSFFAGGTPNSRYKHDRSTTKFVATSESGGGHSDIMWIDEKTANVWMYCSSIKCYGGRTWASGYFIGRQIYLPTQDEKRRKVAECLIELKGAPR